MGAATPRSRKLSAGAFWLLAAVLLALAPRPAAAGCGGGSHGRPVVGLLDLAVLGQPDESAAVDAPPPTAPPPCPGGVCSRDEPGPAAPTTTHSPKRAEHWPCLADARRWTLTSTPAPAPDGPPSHTRPPLATPERPPRLTA